MTLKSRGNFSISYEIILACSVSLNSRLREITSQLDSVTSVVAVENFRLTLTVKSIQIILIRWNFLFKVMIICGLGGGVAPEGSVS